MHYLVCYEIPEEPENASPSIVQRLTEGRTGDYQSIYNKLKEIGGEHFITSTYEVDWEGNADDLIRHLLGDLIDELKGRIKLFVCQLNSNVAAHHV